MLSENRFELIYGYTEVEGYFKIGIQFTEEPFSLCMTTTKTLEFNPEYSEISSGNITAVGCAFWVDGKPYPVEPVLPLLPNYWSEN